MTIDPEVITRHFRSTSAAAWSKKASDVWELVWPVSAVGAGSGSDRACERWSVRSVRREVAAGLRTGSLVVHADL